jgi:hypothetical protein
MLIGVIIIISGIMVYFVTNYNDLYAFVFMAIPVMIGLQLIYFGIRMKMIE